MGARHFLAAFAVLLLPLHAAAGMPAILLSDVARMRFETISFFLLVIALVSLGVQRLWNHLRTDFPRLPRLSYRGALSLVLLWGLGMQLVLTMIAGARELMTPGAWVRQGATYALAASPRTTTADQLHVARQEQLERLRASLWEYAERHEGAFPPDEFGSGIPEPRWRVLDPARLRYVYVGGWSVATPAVPLVFEPGIYGRKRLVLLTTGAIEEWPVERIWAALGEGAG